MTQWLALFVYGTISDVFFISKYVFYIKTIRLSTYIDIFEEKIFQNFFWIFNYPTKMSLWVLKRIVLTSWKRFLILKINQRSFRTRIRHVIQLNIRFVNNVAYSVTERSLMTLEYEKSSQYPETIWDWILTELSHMFIFANK